MSHSGAPHTLHLVSPPQAGEERAIVDDRVRDLYEQAPMAIYAVTPAGTLVSCNSAFARLFGFASSAAAVGADVTALYESGADRDRFVDLVRREGRVEQHAGRRRRLDGQWIEVLETGSGEFDRVGELTEIRGHLVDVTAHVEAQAAIEQRERQYRAVFFEAADAMLILNDRRTIVEANPAAATLFGAAPDTLAGRRLDSLVLDEGDAIGAIWRELLALGEAKREHRIGREGGGIRLVECSYRARVQADRHLCIARDITERRTLEARLLQSEKIESVGRLAGGIAHDFNNLLTAILGYAELLLNRRSQTDPDRPDLEEIHKAGQRAATLTQQLLAFSRKQTLVPKEVDLNQTVTGLQVMLRRLLRENIVLACVVAPRPAFVKVDAGQLEQAIVSLVLNARDALPSGGSIRVEVAHVRLSPADVPADQPVSAAGYVRVQVADTGTGMAPEARAHAFEPFFTTKDIGQGSGLGLSSVYGIVRQSNGLIALDSEPGRGTTVTMHFPAVAAPAEAVVARPAPRPYGRETILLVDEEDSVRAVVGAVLRRQGYQVLEAATAHGACEIFDQHGQEIDLLVSEAVMPEMRALAERLLASRPQLRVLFVSGDEPAAPVAGDRAFAFLRKPFQAPVLLGTVREVLNQAPRDV